MICIPWKLLFVNAVTKLTGGEGQTLPLWLWLVFILSLIPLSALSFHLVERPARRWLKAHAPGARGGATLQPAR
jgi:peptidoglycan/LPS O-acetylase OafA/YrhL